MRELQYSAHEVELRWSAEWHCFHFALKQHKRPLQEEVSGVRLNEENEFHCENRLNSNDGKVCDIF